MDHETTEGDSAPARGFRRRWTEAFPQTLTGESVELVPSQPVSLFDEHELFELQTDESFQYEPSIAPSGHGKLEDESGAVRSDFDAVSRESQPLAVLDPNWNEPEWRRLARSSVTSLDQLSRTTLPWEDSSLSMVFRTGNTFSGTIVSGLKYQFAPTPIGLRDVLQSTVASAQMSTPAVKSEAVQMAPMFFKGIRKEKPDEDIRRLALGKLRDLILSDPFTTQLGQSLWQQSEGASDRDMEQSFQDCFRMKASSTLQKRAQSLWRLASKLRECGVLKPFRITEQQLYVALCKLRSDGAGATSAQHMIEALFFLDGTAKFTLLVLTTVVSGRCRGVARDMYLCKNPLTQKTPLSAAQVRALEELMQSESDVNCCILGQILFCLHSCCRWRDSQRLQSARLEHSKGESVLHADALSSKTSLTLDAKTRFLPYVAIGTGLTGADWAKRWLSARTSQSLSFGKLVPPSYSMRILDWTDTMMGSSEATFWLREFLSNVCIDLDRKKYASHSLKTTVLTWAGRSNVVQFSPTDRRLLGHHVDPSMIGPDVFAGSLYYTLRKGFPDVFGNP